MLHDAQNALTRGPLFPQAALLSRNLYWNPLSLASGEVQISIRSTCLQEGAAHSSRLLVDIHKKRFAGHVIIFCCI